ncbi:hypothetical protein EDB85DRAFT_1904543 [Lactarius pseudohatsudake]|nr:hypothetical protein EDB85DRAFT_1904543 [Lactarius pseudohatsudake]
MYSIRVPTVYPRRPRLRLCLHLHLHRPRPHPHPHPRRHHPLPACTATIPIHVIAVHTRIVTVRVPIVTVRVRITTVPIPPSPPSISKPVAATVPCPTAVYIPTAYPHLLPRHCPNDSPIVVATAAVVTAVAISIVVTVVTLSWPLWSSLVRHRNPAAIGVVASLSHTVVLVAVVWFGVHMRQWMVVASVWWRR